MTSLIVESENTATTDEAIDIFVDQRDARSLEREFAPLMQLLGGGRFRFHLKTLFQSSDVVKQDMDIMNRSLREHCESIKGQLGRFCEIEVPPFLYRVKKTDDEAARAGDDIKKINSALGKLFKEPWDFETDRRTFVSLIMETATPALHQEGTRASACRFIHKAHDWMYLYIEKLGPVLAQELLRSTGGAKADGIILETATKLHASVVWNEHKTSIIACADNSLDPWAPLESQEGHS